MREDDLNGMSYDEWRKSKLSKKKTAKAGHRVVDGKDISNTWERRPDKFAFSIEDVLDAQGFDGLPRVISKEEFDRAVKESKFIAQRTYSAPDQQTLDAYREQLYSGKWYVDCSNGGAQYGQGMYCAANLQGELTDDIRKAMHYYGADTKKYAYVETLTVSKDAKIINFTELQDIRHDTEGLTKTVLNELFESQNITNEYEKIYALSRSGVYIEDTSTVRSWLGSLTDAERRDVNKEVGKLLGLANSKVEELQHMDIGAFGALRGYDVIVAEGGEHTIILNRTKCIFLRGG